MWAESDGENFKVVKLLFFYFFLKREIQLYSVLQRVLGDFSWWLVVHLTVKILRLSQAELVSNTVK